MSLLKEIAIALSRMVVAILFIAIPLGVFKLAAMPALGLNRELPPTVAIGSDAVSFYVNTVSTLLITALGYWCYVRVIERRPAGELAFRPVPKLLGLAAGVFLIGLPVLILYAGGYYRLISYEGFSDATFAVGIVVAIAVFLEEVVFRGIVFSILEQYLGTLAALLVQSALFSAVHLANDNWAGLMPVVSGFLIGCLWTSLFVVYRNLWVLALHHAAWNLTIFATGLPLSGIDEWRQAAPFHSDLYGPSLITGSVSGPEASILTPVVVLAAFAALIFRARQRELILPPRYRQPPASEPAA